MKPEIKELWMNALPNYKQGKQCLCDLYVKETGKAEWDDKHYRNENYTIFGEEELLPYEVAEWAGLDEQNPFYIDPEHPKAEPDDNGVYLTVLNDRGYTFEEIKQVIAKHF
jgi:hypothetical protein